VDLLSFAAGPEGGLISLSTAFDAYQLCCRTLFVKLQLKMLMKL
jgi:hypothetical protein